MALVEKTDVKWPEGRPRGRRTDNIKMAPRETEWSAEDWIGRQAVDKFRTLVNAARKLLNPQIPGKLSTG
jgi:hypothetical protein